MQKIYQYVVEGAGEFPWDMLRRGRCWPASEEDVQMMVAATIRGTSRRRVVLHGLDRPLIDRWASFNWLVNPDC